MKNRPIADNVLPKITYSLCILLYEFSFWMILSSMMAQNLKGQGQFSFPLTQI